MYTDEDLEHAVEASIFSAAAVDQFRREIAQQKKIPIVDQENFRLMTGFNDIFVVIACILLMTSAVFLIESLQGGMFSMIGLAGLSWLLSEFFVRQRKMALPAIVLLVGFVTGTLGAVLAGLGVNALDFLNESSMLIATSVTAVATYFHWRRFRVPITIAAGTLVGLGFIASLLLSFIPELEHHLTTLIFSLGVLTFIFAMYWDASDRERVTGRSDAAFWLHLLAAPMIVHPIFMGQSIMDSRVESGTLIIVLSVYLLLTLISIAVDRRVFMVSSLVYVLYALSDVFEQYGSIDYSFAVTGVILGASLLLLSVLWQRARRLIIGFFPKSIVRWVPVVASK